MGTCADDSAAEATSGSGGGVEQPARSTDTSKQKDTLSAGAEDDLGMHWRPATLTISSPKLGSGERQAATCPITPQRSFVSRAPTDHSKSRALPGVQTSRKVQAASPGVRDRESDPLKPSPP